MRKYRVFVLLLLCELLAAWFFVRLRDQYTVKPKPQKAQILPSFTPFWQGIWCRISNRFIVRAPLIGITEQMDRAVLIG